jgi:2-C-methyl-D-erythritol 4-phosphate cytidylyltransferase/2-C-methyl-D-erythritol 2,4-cyclodiphosphate synthase
MQVAETYALIPAAGRGERFRRPYNKVLAPLAGRPLLCHTLAAFQNTPEVDALLLMTDADSLSAVRSLVNEHGFTKVRSVLLGGATRQASVRVGLDHLPSGCETVAVHDAARALVTPDIVRRCVLSARQHGSGVAAVPVVDTLKATDETGWATATVDREGLWAVQTPQAFLTSLLLRAHQEADAAGFVGTDETSLVERLGVPVRLVEGATSNLKVTRPEDADVAEALLARGSEVNEVGPALSPLRVGHGYDIHRLVPGRELWLGGVCIPSEVGLLGHSDADVALHALMDALLGAAGLPDIGHLFPNTNPAYSGASSLRLLEEVSRRVLQEGWRVGNVDLTVLAERPKIARHIAAMKDAIGPVLGLAPNQIGIKATTHEGVGALGRGEAIVAQAVALLMRGG